MVHALSGEPVPEIRRACVAVSYPRSAWPLKGFLTFLAFERLSVAALPTGSAHVTAWWIGALNTKSFLTRSWFSMHCCETKPFRVLSTTDAVVRHSFHQSRRAKVNELLVVNLCSHVNPPVVYLPLL